MSDEVVLKPSLISAVPIRFLKGVATKNRNYGGKRDYLPHSILSIGLTLAVVGVSYLLSRIFAPNLAILTLFIAIPVWPSIQMYFLIREMQYRKYIIRDDGVEVVDDYLDKSSTSVGFENATDVSLSRPLFQRLFGTGNVKVETAGSDRAEIQFKYLKDAEDVQEELAEMVRNTEYKQGYDNQVNSNNSNNQQRNNSQGQNNGFNQGGRR